MGYHHAPASRLDRGTSASLLLILWIAILDLSLPRTNISILYILPLLLLVRAGSQLPLRRAAAGCMALTLGIYFLKNTVSLDHTASYFDYRLINRTLVVLMIGGISLLLNRWGHSRADAAIDASHAQRGGEAADSGAGLATVSCLAAVLLIAAIDFRSPANFNWAILYPVPLFICGWFRGRAALWGMLGILLVLSLFCYWCGPSATLTGHDDSLARNRMLAIVVMSGVALIVHGARHRPDSGK